MAIKYIFKVSYPMLVIFLLQRKKFHLPVNIYKQQKLKFALHQKYYEKLRRIIGKLNYFAYSSTVTSS